VGDLCASRIPTDENVYSEVILPEVSNLEPVQVVRPPQGVDYVFADDNLPPMARVSLLIPGVFILCLRWHHLFQLLIGETLPDGLSRSSPALSQLKAVSKFGTIWSHFPESYLCRADRRLHYKPHVTNGWNR
jgi:hypothetical protein